MLHQRDEEQRSPEDHVRGCDDHEHFHLLDAFPFDAQQVVAHPLVFFHGAQAPLRTNRNTGAYYYRSPAYFFQYTVDYPNKKKK